MTTPSQGSKFRPISPNSVRYIKLGDGGRWERECINGGLVRFGFGSANEERFPLCLAGDWDALRESFIREGKTAGTSTRFVNETKLFFEDDGTTLWITFFGEKLWWGFLTSAPAKRHPDGDGVWRSVDGGWRSTDKDGEPLDKGRLSGALNKLAAYRGTTCSVDVSAYVIRRINGLKSEKVERARAVLCQMQDAIFDLIRDLGDRDFEILVDLIFTHSGWQRQGIVGKTQKTLDLDILLPSTEQSAIVQVKSSTNSNELAEYIKKFADLNRDKMFYVFHSGQAESDDERVIVIGPDRLAKMAIDAGLIEWLIRKVS